MNVEVDAPAQQDLSSILASIREHYETVASKNRRDIETWFQAKVGPSSTWVLRGAPSPLLTLWFFFSF